MGTTQDFAVAAQEGATIVRIGTACTPESNAIALISGRRFCAP